jgi:hypothetical protein
MYGVFYYFKCEKKLLGLISINRIFNTFYYYGIILPISGIRLGLSRLIAKSNSANISIFNISILNISYTTKYFVNLFLS